MPAARTSRGAGFTTQHAAEPALQQRCRLGLAPAVVPAASVVPASVRAWVTDAGCLRDDLRRLMCVKGQCLCAQVRRTDEVWHQTRLVPVELNIAKR